jgi:hypothetical protein
MNLPKWMLRVAFIQGRTTPRNSKLVDTSWKRTKPTTQAGSVVGAHHALLVVPQEVTSIVGRGGSPFRVRLLGQVDHRIDIMLQASQRR